MSYEGDLALSLTLLGVTPCDDPSTSILMTVILSVSQLTLTLILGRPASCRFFLHLFYKRAIVDKWQQFCYGKMLFAARNEQHQSTEGNSETDLIQENYSLILSFLHLPQMGRCSVLRYWLNRRWYLELIVVFWQDGRKASWFLSSSSIIKIHYRPNNVADMRLGRLLGVARTTVNPRCMNLIQQNVTKTTRVNFQLVLLLP